MRYVLAALLGLLFATAATTQDELRDWVQELQKKNDDADVKLISRIANVGNREAAEGLLAAYDAMKSIYMRREIVRALARFDGVAEAEQPCMEKLANIAGNCEDAEVREAAIRGLGQSARLGKHYLQQLVESDASEDVREQAMKAHVKMASADDAAWYRHVWNLKAEQRKDAKGNIEAPESNSIRLLAFGGLAEQLSEDELIEALRREYDPKIRRAALKAMADRDLPKTTEEALRMLGRVDLQGGERAMAAKLLAERDPGKAVPEFLELMKKRDVTQDDLREEMARLLSKMNEEPVKKRLARLIGKGKPHEKVFALQATARLDDPKVKAAVRKELLDKEPEVRAAAAAAVAQRRDQEAVPQLRKMLAGKVPGDQRLAIDAISAIEDGSNAWLEELVQLSNHADRDLRNAAIEQLAAAKNVRFLPVLSTAMEHEDWSTRLCAMQGLVALGDKSTVPKLIERLAKETGRMRKLVGEALWQLTGQQFEQDLAQWQAWWQAEGKTFEVVSKAELEKAAKARELRRLQERTRSGAKFFGIHVESSRVLFILDVSGSMLESVYGRTAGKRGGVSRLDVAKQELVQCIKSLEPTALFNVFAFSDGVARWLDGKIADSSEANRQAAITWIDRLGARGGTNLFDSVQQAFDDKDVDTIFILSDGEPSVGAEIDPSRIREQIAALNKHRHVKINTIAVGGNFEVLEWLAADSGGKHVQIR